MSTHFLVEQIRRNEQITPNKKHAFSILELEDDYIEFYLDGKLLGRFNHEDHGYTGMQAAYNLVYAIAQTLGIEVELGSLEE